MIAFLNDDIDIKTALNVEHIRVYTSLLKGIRRLSMKKKINDRKQYRTDHIVANLLTNNTWITSFDCFEWNTRGGERTRMNECVISNLIFYLSLIHSSVWLHNAGGWNNERLIIRNNCSIRLLYFFNKQKTTAEYIDRLNDN